MLSSATSVDGQGVGSAYLEQVSLVKAQQDLYSVYINKEKLPKGEKNQIIHVHTVDPAWRAPSNCLNPRLISSRNM